MNIIKIYSKKNCPKCEHLKGLLKESRNADIIMMDVENSANMNWMKSKQAVNVPVMAIYNSKGEELVIFFGFTRDNVANKFKNHTGDELFG